MKKYVSFSELYLWYRDKEEYIDRYIKGIEYKATPEQFLGKTVHQVIEDPRYDWLKILKQEGYGHKEIMPIRKAISKLHAKTKYVPERERAYIAETPSGIKLFCFWDGWDGLKKELYEYKTSKYPERWNQKIVDYHKQLSFYAYAYWLNTHGFFRNIHLYFADLAKGNVKHYQTARGRRDIEWIANWIEEGVVEIKKSGLWEKRLARNEQYKRFTEKLV